MATKSRIQKVPRLLRHRDLKRVDRAYVTLSRRRVYIGTWGDPDVKARYDALISKWLANDREIPDVLPLWESDWSGNGQATSEDPGTTVGELVELFTAWAARYYRRTNGTTTGEHVNLEIASRPLVELFGGAHAAQFNTKHLGLIREQLLDLKFPKTGKLRLSRKVINQRIQSIRRIFRWGEEEGLVPEGKTAHLATLKHLKPGR